MDHNKDMGMDKVDEGQQIGITRLQSNQKNMFIGFFVTLMMLVLIIVALMANKEINCPHKECPHYILEAK